MNLAPIELWRGNEGARKDWHQFINSSQARAAIAFALADYQREVSGLPEGAFMLRGANGIIDRILNMGDDKTRSRLSSFQLPVQE